MRAASKRKQRSSVAGVAAPWFPGQPRALALRGPAQTCTGGGEDKGQGGRSRWNRQWCGLGARGRAGGGLRRRGGCCCCLCRGAGQGPGRGESQEEGGRGGGTEGQGFGRKGSTDGAGGPAGAVAGGSGSLACKEASAHSGVGGRRCPAKQSRRGLDCRYRIGRPSGGGLARARPAVAPPVPGGRGRRWAPAGRIRGEGRARAARGGLLDQGCGGAASHRGGPANAREAAAILAGASCWPRVRVAGMPQAVGALVAGGGRAEQAGGVDQGGASGP
mmetsp:Transcript_65328/g.165490  ORF Transcript_65328/g.165490 Transcript_65328/m.165490 type:complete len:275 (+) Transcript_65328:185-1009(+)